MQNFSEAAIGLFPDLRAAWMPPLRLSSSEWASQYRYLSAESSAIPGKYDIELTPWVRGILDALDDPDVWKVVCMKSAQIAWTDGVINNYIGARIAMDPCPMIAMFPKAGSAREYSLEKFAPMVEVTPVLASLVDVRANRRDGNTALFKKFRGGFLKLVGSNSPASVKSTPAELVIVEEPDDANRALKGQGDSIKLLEERSKTYGNRKVIFGGTPSMAGLSTIEEQFASTDQRRFYVPCHACGEAHALAWDNVQWETDPRTNHEVFGQALPETAHYRCPHCRAPWTDLEKNANVRRGQWRPGAKSRGIAGFALSELYSPFPASTFERLVERYLEAEKTYRDGDDKDRIVFVNSALGEPYSFEGDGLDAEQLAARAEDYPELEIPAGGVIVTAGIDVQHDRLAVVLRAWGRGEESWLVFWGELYGVPNDSGDAVWGDLEGLLYKPIPCVASGELSVGAVSIDASDGHTNDAVYSWVRDQRLKGPPVMAVKGSSELGDREIFSPPKRSIDHATPTKASRYGLRVYMVGTARAKDLIHGRLKLGGDGPGRFHFPDGVRADYFDQITAEVKAPSRTARGRRVWQVKSGRRNESFDCEVYALHAARRLKTHLMKPAQWDQLETRSRQRQLFSADEPEQETPEPDTSPREPIPKKPPEVSQKPQRNFRDAWR